MAYSRRPSRRRSATARRSYGARTSYRARPVRSRSYRGRAASGRRRSGGGGRQTVRLELVMSPASEVRTPASVMMKEAPPAKKAKF